MKKLFLAFVLFASAAFAEPSFNEMQNLIDQKQFAAAEQGLELIIKNHPNSAKAFYSMAQAQAGLGHQDKAQFALNKAKGLDPSLKFASESNVSALEAAITPQVAKIEKVESSMSWLTIFLIAIVVLGLVILARIIYLSKRDDEDTPDSVSSGDKPILGSSSPASDAVSKKYINTRYASDVEQRRYSYPSNVVSTQPHVTNHYSTTNGSSSDGLLTGVLLGSLISSSNHESTTHESISQKSTSSVSTPEVDNSWDDTSKTVSSSWDSGSSSSSSSDSSSSWDSSSSSSSFSDSTW